MEEKKKASAARIAANARYNLKAYEQIRAWSRRDLKRIEALKQIAQARGLSYQEYILQLIDDGLQRDGVTVSDLPPAEDETSAED